jgi:hypothetical protein
VCGMQVDPAKAPGSSQYENVSLNRAGFVRSTAVWTVRAAVLNLAAVDQSRRPPYSSAAP